MGAGASAMAERELDQAASHVSQETRDAIEKLPKKAQDELIKKALLLPPAPVNISTPRQHDAEAKAKIRARNPRLSIASFDRAVATYATTADLRLLLTHNERLCGVPIRLVSVRWLLSEFKATDTTRLEHRQALERAYGDAPFIHGEKLERVLAELEEVDRDGDGSDMAQVYKTKVDGEYKAVEMDGDPMPIGFPSAAALSHMWLDPSHPDPEAKNLRTQWLAPLEW